MSLRILKWVLKIKSDSGKNVEMLLVPMYSIYFSYDSNIRGRMTENAGKKLIFDIFAINRKS